jgi:MYXO-CTERM domain-containing protein
MPVGDLTRTPIDGEPCWFSSAGPTLTGVPKPEIMAPGAAIVGALSQQAVPPSPESIFSNGQCTSMGDPGCQQIDAQHAVAAGTSFSAPIVAGTIAVMLQHDPTLTQDQVLAALQGGAHPLRGPAPFPDQAGVGEVDVLGAVAAVDRLRDPTMVVPVRSESWIALGADEFLADGSTPLEAVIELRAAPTGTTANPADGFVDTRLAASVLVDGQPYDGAAQLSRRGPGVWVETVQLPAGLGGSSLTIGATFDGEPIVDPMTVPIATDVWTAMYPITVRGGCSASNAPPSTRGSGGLALVALAGWGLRRRRAQK